MGSGIIALGQAIRSGKVFTYIPPDKRLTPQEAARILNVQVSYLNKLLDEKAIPHVLTGTQRHVKYMDLMDYKS